MRTSTYWSILAFSVTLSVAAWSGPPKDKAAPRVVALDVTGDGFVPDSVKLKANQPVKFIVTRKTDETCATEMVIDGTDIKVELPLNKPVEVSWTPKKAGSVKFGCAMGMMVSGVLLVE